MTRKGFGLRAIAIGGFAAVLMAAVPAAHAEDKVVVFAAASLKDALDAVNKACEADVGKAATISYAASSALAKQIEGGAPADVFISADLDWMKYLSDKKLTKPDTEVKLLGNEIVLVAPKDSKVEDQDREGFRPRQADRRRQARHGRRQGGAGRQIRQGGAGIARRLVFGRGQGRAGRERSRRAEAGFDRRGRRSASSTPPTRMPNKGVKVVGTFPEDSHPPIIYPVAQTADSKDKDTPAFLKCLQSAKAGEAVQGTGFYGARRRATEIEEA